MLTTSKDALRSWLPGWTIVESIDETIDVGGLGVHRVGITAKSADAGIATGAAAGLDPADARRRAEAELLERASIVEATLARTEAFVRRSFQGIECGIVPRDEVFDESDAPSQWQPSRSNGVALASDWSSACRHAMLELVERDRLLRAWRGEIAPARMAFADESLRLVRTHAWQAFRFSVQERWSNDVEVVMVIGFPLRDGVPLVRGSAADFSVEAALRRALGECLQGLAFLCDAEIPDRAPVESPTPLHHLDAYLWPGAHARLRRWLAGEHVGCADRLARDADATIAWVDLTPTAAKGRFHVARAQCEAALPLFFGRGPTWWTRSMPKNRWVHPIA